jgi:8-oxo-dGTP diphosphatase
MTQHYVNGFMFSPDHQRVALIHKRQPTWQAGYLNGIGGKIELGETAAEAMVREFSEETGVATAQKV